MLNGYELERLRHSYGLTQQDVSDVSGISIRWIKKIENQNESMSEETYKKILNAIYTANRDELIAVRKAKREKEKAKEIAKEKAKQGKSRQLPRKHKTE